MKTSLKIFLLLLFLLAVPNDRSRERFEGLTETKLKKKHFCPPWQCRDSESVQNYSLERNRWCRDTGHCPPTSVNTVFLTDLETLQEDWDLVHTRDGPGFEGKELVRTWTCSSLLSSPHCSLGPRPCCYPGPFLETGHLQYRETLCRADGC